MVDEQVYHEVLSIDERRSALVHGQAVHNFTIDGKEKEGESECKAFKSTDQVVVFADMRRVVFAIELENAVFAVDWRLRTL